MISVFICEDNIPFQKDLLNCVNDCISIEELDMEVAVSTDDPAQIFNYIQTEKVHGLYFLDVELGGGYNGIEVAKNIRQYDPRGFVVFVTSHPQYMPLTFEYQVEAMDYIQKAKDNVLHNRINESIKNAYAKHVSRSEEGNLVFKPLNGCKVSCVHKDILFAETDPLDSRRLILHTKKKQYVFTGGLTELSKILPQGLFFKCHKSYLINITNISENGKEALRQGAEKIIMSNGNPCSIATRKRRELLKMLDTPTNPDSQVLQNKFAVPSF